MTHFDYRCCYPYNKRFRVRVEGDEKVREIIPATIGCGERLGRRGAAGSLRAQASTVTPAVRQDSRQLRRVP